MIFLLLLIFAAPARGEWRRAESPHFVLYGEQSERALRERILLLEDFGRLLRAMARVDNTPAPNRLHIYILGSERELRSIRNLPPGAGGFYTATVEGIGAFVDGSSSRGNELLFHEYAHHFMLQHGPLAYPAWYVEGFAEYFMTARFTPRMIEIGAASIGRAQMVLNGRWLPIAQILSGPSVFRLSREERAQFYAQSWLLTHYLQHSGASSRAGRLSRRGAARDPVAALAGATRLTPAQLESELRRYIGDRRIPVLRMQQGEPQAPPVTVATLSPGADAVIADAATLRIGVGAAYRKSMLTRLRAAMVRFPNDPFVQRTLAHAEALYGDGAAADRLLEPLLAAHPNDAELMYLKGRRYLAEAERPDASPDAARTARDWFGRAHRADGNHYQTLYRYVQNQMTGGNYLSETTQT